MNVEDTYNRIMENRFSKDEMKKNSRNVMEDEKRKIVRNTKNKTEILDIFQFLETRLPAGCRLNKGNIKINFPDGSGVTHVFRKRPVPEKDIKDTLTKDDLLTIIHEVKKLSKHLYREWRFTKVIVRKDDRIYDILGGLERILKGPKASLRMDDQKDGMGEEYRYSKRMDEEETTQDEQRMKVFSQLGGTVNIVHYEHNEYDEELVNIDLDSKNKNIDQEFVKAVYSGGDINMDAYKGIVDKGAPKTVAGKAWLEAFTKDSPWMEIKRYRENETFRLGNGLVYTSTLGHIIPVTIGNLRT